MLSINRNASPSGGHSSKKKLLLDGGFMKTMGETMEETVEETVGKTMETCELNKDDGIYP